VPQSSFVIAVSQSPERSVWGHGSEHGNPLFRQFNNAFINQLLTKCTRICDVRFKGLYARLRY